MNKLLTYAIVRYVGDPVRGEAANVGVVVVDEEAGQAAVKFEPRAAKALRQLWPEFDSRAYRSLTHDLRHLVGAPHQLRLEETAGLAPVSANATLATLRGYLANQFQVGEAQRYSAESADAAASKLYERLVAHDVRPKPRSNYMTRSELRDMISRLLREAALASRSATTVEEDVEVEGRLAPHHVDVVAYVGGLPSEMIFAIPTQSEDLMRYRDSVPTAVSDIAAANPEVEFLAVLADGSEDSGEAVEVTRSLLQTVPRLKVLSLADLKHEVERSHFVHSET